MKNFNILFFIFLLLFSNLYATPVRIIGMGSLDLVVEDESNLINLFDYGRNVAGLYTDERGSSFESYFSYGNIEYQDSSGTIEPAVSYLGINLPSYFNITMNSLTDVSGIPVCAIFTYRTEKGLAYSGCGAYSSNKWEYDSQDMEEDASMPIGCFLFSKDFGLYSAGASAGYTRVNFTNDQNDDEIYATLKGTDGGVAVHLSPMLEIGISAGFALPEAGTKSEFLGQKYRNTFKGNAFAAGVQGIVRIPGLLKLGTRFDFLNADLDGETKMGNVSVDIGNVGTTDFNLGSRLLFSSILLPVKVGANLDYRRLHPVYNTEETILPGFDNSISSTNFGFGIGYAMVLFTPGLQYEICNISTTDNLGDNDETTNSTNWDLSLGAELNLSVVILRAGYIMGKDDPDRAVEDDESNNRSITGGASIELPLQPFKLELAYVNKETKPVDNPTDRKDVDNSVLVAFRMKF